MTIRHGGFGDLFIGRSILIYSLELVLCTVSSMRPILSTVLSSD
jgi:hypothetical protein